MSTALRVVLAQLNPTVGDVAGNGRRIEQWICRARDVLHADLIVFPELALAGYPPEDLLLRPAFVARVEAEMQRLAARTRGLDVLVGHPWRDGDVLYNAVSWLRGGSVLARYRKRVLPNYGVFDECRYFRPGEASCVQRVRGVSVGVVICEDAWAPAPVQQTVAAGAELVVVANASPFHRGKASERRAVVASRARESAVPILYANLVGGQDELVFDGGSFAVSAEGVVQAQGSFFAEDQLVVDWDGRMLRSETQTGLLDADDEVVQALRLGVADYVHKNHFPGALVGLSGGIDSAVTLAVAVQALGAARVRAVMMPSAHTSTLSLDLAQAQATALGVTYDVLPIDRAVVELAALSAQGLADVPKGVVVENLQARVRGVLLMALSNATGALVLTTGNKSEMAVGYATLYGDMAGGFAVLKDVTKTWVYRVAARINAAAQRAGRGPEIPPGVLSRAPTAELAPGQLDADSLPPYDRLDRLIEAYVEENQPFATVAADCGLPPAQVAALLQRIRASEYKRRQSAPGVRISRRGFGRDWRYPITSQDREEEPMTTEDAYEKN